MGKAGVTGVRCMAAALALAACAPRAETVAEGRGAACDVGRYASLVGVRESEIDRRGLPQTFRIVCADCMATMDHRPDRLHIQLGPDGRVQSVRCG